MDGMISLLKRALDSEAAPPTTLVLMGRTGNGKSATGNSILGKPAFKSKTSSFAVTGTCQLESATLPDGRVIRVVDTPGLFEVSMSQEDIKAETVKCLELAKDGFHALLLVLSTRNRFTAEEIVAMVESLQVFFGEEVLQYVIVVFTNGDSLEDAERTLEEYCEEAPDGLKQLLDRFGNRTILFNNRTKLKTAKDRQTSELLQTVADIVRRNGGTPYTNEMFREAQALAQQKSKEKSIVEDKRKLEAVSEQLQQSMDIAQVFSAFEKLISELHQKLGEQDMEGFEEQYMEFVLACTEFEKSMTEYDKYMKEQQQKLLNILDKLRQFKELQRARGNGGRPAPDSVLFPCFLL